MNARVSEAQSLYLHYRVGPILLLRIHLPFGSGLLRACVAGAVGINPFIFRHVLVRAKNLLFAGSSAIFINPKILSHE